VLGRADDTTLLNPDFVRIYGWSEPTVRIGDRASSIWLLVATDDGRLAWMANKGLTYLEADLTPTNFIDQRGVNNLSPTRLFESRDLGVLLRN
jgi:hypothetical protein